MQFPILDHYIHTQRKVHLVLIVAFQCLWIFSFYENSREKTQTCDQLHQIVQRLLSITNYECNVERTKKLCWWEWMYWKIWMFTITFPKPVSLQNLCISYDHNFSIGSNLEMYWNFNPHKTVHLKTPEKWPFLLNYLQRFSKLRHWLWYASAQGYLSLLILDVNKCILWKTEHYEVLSLSKTSFQVEFLCKCCYCGLFMCSFQLRINTFIQTERTSNKNRCETDHFTLNPGENPKMLVLITMQKHSLNVMKLWTLWNTWNLCRAFIFY